MEFFIFSFIGFFGSLYIFKKTNFLNCVDDFKTRLFQKLSLSSGHIKWRLANIACWTFCVLWIVAVAPMLSTYFHFGSTSIGSFVYGKYGILIGFKIYDRWILSTAEADNYMIACICSTALVKIAMSLTELTEVLAQGLRFEGSTRGRFMNVSVWK